MTGKQQPKQVFVKSVKTLLIIWKKMKKEKQIKKIEDKLTSIRIRTTMRNKLHLLKRFFNLKTLEDVIEKLIKDSVKIELTSDGKPLGVKVKR